MQCHTLHLYIDLKSISKSGHDTSIFDELTHHCDAVLLLINLRLKTALLTTNNNSHIFNLLIMTTMNDYERRFQCSLQKLSVPTWYNDNTPSLKISNKPLITSTHHFKREANRTPEVAHVHRLQNHRSCRSSLDTSQSPSEHSWHPNYMTDGMYFSPSLPFSLSTSRRYNKYEKGIERVAKSSRWYQPTQFITENSNRIGKLEVIFLKFIDMIVSFGSK